MTPENRISTVNPTDLVARPVQNGWAVCLSNGTELARFLGAGAKQRAFRYRAKLASLKARDGR